MNRINIKKENLHNTTLDDEQSQVIIITGMHRSGTSLVASLLQSAGVSIGDELLPAKFDNPSGYFEDLDFYNFQEKILKKRGLNILVTTREPILLDDEEVNFAKELIRLKSSQQLWGWKDPRTTLFLDFWHQLLPSARFLLIYRHPVEVFLSLLKRGDLIDNPLSGLLAWEIYNEHILSFVKKHPGQAILCHIHGILNNKEEFSNLLRSRLELPKNGEFEKVYHSESLHHLSIPKWLDLFVRQKYPIVLDLYEQLQQEAHLPFKNSSDLKISDKKILSLLDYTTEAVMTVRGKITQENQELKQLNEELQKGNQVFKEQTQRVRERNQQLQEQNQRVRERNQQLRKDNERLYQNNQQLREDNEKLLQSKAVLFARELQEYPVLAKVGSLIYTVLAKVYHFFKKMGFLRKAT